ncbi:helix-turn-helix domain-containing protein [Nonomuraea sp. NPDC049695]|uniref:helix-turn-helix domain-containing protein n=1 Tax=Nonomuraea sp. NPDC049695 TaxID=3154734 RepID=UPI003429369D
MSIPPGRLRRWISDITVWTDFGPGDRLVHVPDADTALVVRRARDGRCDLLVTGPRTRATYNTGKDIPFSLRLRLRPGSARPLLGVRAGELVDRVVGIGELWPGSDDLVLRLSEAGTDAGLVLKHLEPALLARIATRTPADLARSELVRAAATSLTRPAGPGREPVPAIARRLAVSERHLRGLFADGVGLPPKRFERITRVRRVLADGRASGWAAAGYYDQSHMTAEFRVMMGVTPGAFFAGRLPALQPC